MLTEAFHPVSEPGRRVVTLHGDFKTDNILKAESGALVPIDFEMTTVGPAVSGTCPAVHTTPSRHCLCRTLYA